MEITRIMSPSEQLVEFHTSEITQYGSIGEAVRQRTSTELQPRIYDIDYSQARDVWSCRVVVPGGMIFSVEGSPLLFWATEEFVARQGKPRGGTPVPV